MRFTVPAVIACLVVSASLVCAQEKKPDAAKNKESLPAKKPEPVPAKPDAAPAKDAAAEARVVFDELVAEARARLDKSLAEDKERLARMSDAELQSHVRNVLTDRPGFEDRERRGPPKEAVERFNKLSDEAKAKLRKEFEANREKVASMAPEERRKFMEETFKKIADEDAKNASAKTDKKE